MKANLLAAAAVILCSTGCLEPLDVEISTPEGPAPSEEATVATPEETAPAEEQPTVRTEAKVGVGAKGDYGPGFVTTPVSAYFRTQERVTFLQVKQALDFYKVEHGRGPSSHEEYMEKIIEANRLELPTLPAKSRFVYDPKTEQLMVEHPK